MVSIDPHPLLDCAVFSTVFPLPLGSVDTPGCVAALLTDDVDAPMATDDNVRLAVRDLLRHGGFKPTGRSKPASEYLIKAVAKEWIAPQRTINPAVDTCNAVSLHSGLPISVIDLDKATVPLRIGIAAHDTRYVFNPSEQVIDIGGLLAVFDAHGACAGPVKDAQRTKTDETTTRTMSVIWGTHTLAGRTRITLDWYVALLAAMGAQVDPITPTAP